MVPRALTDHNSMPLNKLLSIPTPSIAYMDNVLSELENYRIYLGTWTDWTRGRVLGATLTLTRQNGTLLVAFIALFVTIVSTSFWTLSCFAFHHFFSSESARDGLHHQRQIILRNSANSVSGIARLFQLLLAWRKIAKRPYRRVLPLLLLSSLILVGFAACSGFSSKISSALDSDVLILGDRCGLSHFPDDVNITTVLLESSYQGELMANAANYALQCYTNRTGSEGCQRYKKPRLPFSVHTNASCPFHNGMCLSLDQNILLDTGYVHTLHDLGINSPPDDQLLFRKVDHCAPLNLTGRQGHHTDTETGITYRTYYLGSVWLKKAPFTYQYPEMDYMNLNENKTSPDADYTLSTLEASSINGSYDNSWSDFYPIPELVVPDADIGLFFLSANGIFFTEPVRDLWYAASRNSGNRIVIDAFPGTSAFYLQDDVVSVLGCTSRRQWCNPNISGEDQCQSLGGAYHTLHEPIPGSHNKQVKLYDWHIMTVATLMPTMSSIASKLGLSALTARFKLRFAFQGPLPDNQWQLEVQHWFSTSMASLQDAFVATAAGVPYPELRPFFSPPETAEQRSVCRNQRVRSAAHMNFSIFGMAIIFSVGGLIIIASYSIEPFVAWLQRRRGLDSYSRLEWCTNETIQLQRLANEEIGLGVWDRTDETIPVTGQDDSLAVLDLTDPKHPRLRAPPVSYEEEFHVGSQKIADDSPEPGEADQGKIIREDIQETGEKTMETQVRQNSEEDDQAQNLNGIGYRTV